MKQWLHLLARVRGDLSPHRPRWLMPPAGRSIAHPHSRTTVLPTWRQWHRPSSMDDDVRIYERGSTRVVALCRRQAPCRCISSQRQPEPADQIAFAD